MSPVYRVFGGYAPRFQGMRNGKPFSIQETHLKRELDHKQLTVDARSRYARLKIAVVERHLYVRIGSFSRTLTIFILCANPDFGVFKPSTSASYSGTVQRNVTTHVNTSLRTDALTATLRCWTPLSNSTENGPSTEH
ncbi:hypothetical protein RJ035_004550 [Blastomyces gilchristii]